MRSKLMEQLKQEQRQEFAAMTPAQRVAMTELLGDQGLAEFMSANGVDRTTAIRVIKRSRRLGRRPSGCLDERD